MAFIPGIHNLETLDNILRALSHIVSNLLNSAEPGSMRHSQRHSLSSPEQILPSVCLCYRWMWLFFHLPPEMSENPAGTLSQRARHSNTQRTKSPSVGASRPCSHTRAGRAGHCDTCPTKWATSLCFSQHTWPALQSHSGYCERFLSAFYTV